MGDIIGLILVICTSMFIGVIMGVFLYADNSMTPMDVYQGKTTLEYKVVDGVKVDSTVVWKNHQ